MPFPLLLRLRGENVFHTFLSESIWNQQNERNSSAMTFLSFKEKKKKRYSKAKLSPKISDPKVNKRKTRKEEREEGTVRTTWQERQKCSSH